MQPLDDLRVLGVTVFLAGPYLSMNLARMGAEVIKVEIPGKGDPVRGNGPFAGPSGIHDLQESDQDISTRFLKRTQGVKSVTLNLKDPEGRQMFLDMAKQSDIILENLAPGSMQRLGLGYSDVSNVNPEIIYCSISGYGQSGPYSDKPAHDPQIQGMSGLMDINGDADGAPTKVGFYIGDLVTPLFAAYSIMVNHALEAAETLAAEGINAEVINLRTLRPLDTEAIVNSVKKTNRMVTVEEGWPVAGMGSEIAVISMEYAFDYLDGPIVRLAGPEVPAMPFSPPLEEMFMVDAAEIANAMRQLANY